MLKEHQINSADNFIMGWYQDDFSLIDDMLNYSKNSEKLPGEILGHSNERIVDKTFKDSLDCCLFPNTQMFDRYAQYLQPCANAYIKKYPMSNMQAPWSITDTIKIQTYPLGGGFFNWHTERTSMHGSVSGLHLVFMTYLNTIESGGETEFFHQQLKIKPEKGLTLIWPADWTFTHRGNPSYAEEKIIATGWYHFID